MIVRGPRSNNDQERNAMQVRIVTAAFVLAYAFAAATPASAWTGLARDGDQCWKQSAWPAVGHFEPCPPDKTQATTHSSSGRTHSKHR
jgi:hypothetical protein